MRICPRHVTFEDEELKPKLRDANAPQKVHEWLKALGGKENITKVESCAQTRLRLKVKDHTLINSDSLEAEGVNAVTTIDDSLFHLLVGLNADQYAAEMNAQLAG